MNCRAEGNSNPSRLSDFGVLEQYLGFRIGDSSNLNRSMCSVFLV